MATTLNSLLASQVQDLAGALGIAVVDIETAMLMGVHHNVPYFTQSFLDNAAAGTVEMFRGKNIRRIEEHMAEMRGIPNTSSMIDELFFSTPKTFHFAVTIKEKNCVILLITSKDTNQGMAWSALRRNIKAIADLLP